MAADKVADECITVYTNWVATMKVAYDDYAKAGTGGIRQKSVEFADLVATQIAFLAENMGVWGDEIASAGITATNADLTRFGNCGERMIADATKLSEALTAASENKDPFQIRQTFKHAYYALGWLELPSDKRSDSESGNARCEDDFWKEYQTDEMVARCGSYWEKEHNWGKSWG